MSHDDLDGLLEGLVPGQGRRAQSPPGAPIFPPGLDLEPIDVLGRGSVGWIFRAHDPRLDRVVAVKIARPDRGEPARAALLHEARTTARIAHPSVLPVHAVVVADGLLCAVFALGPTTTLADRLIDWRNAPESALTQESRLAVLHGIADAVARAHGLGIVHGDLKPQNIAIDADIHAYVLDWSGLQGGEGSFSGTPEYAAPELLRGQVPSPASDAFAFAALAFEVLVGRPMRPGRPGESVADYIARHRDGAGVPAEGALAPIEPTLAAVLAAATQPDPAARPDAAAVRDAIGAALTGRAEQARREAEAEASLAEARRGLVTFHERERRVEEERRWIAVQRMMVPPNAPLAAKKTLWAAQARALGLVNAQAETWTAAAEHAIAAAHLVPNNDEAHAITAELWWERLRMAEEYGYVGESELSRARVRAHDRGRFAGLMTAAGAISIPGPGALAIARVDDRGPLLAEVPHARLTLPVARLELAPGSWVLTVTRPGRVPARLPVRLDRLAHLELDPWPPEALPDGWCAVMAGAFRMGGDEAAREPVDRCAPWLGDLWARRTCVTSAEYLDFLRSLPHDEAARRSPAQDAIVGPPTRLWPTLALPPGWDPDWAVVGIDLDDATAFAAWTAARSGIAARLPTQEEWEKAARGADGRIFPWGSAFDPSLCHMGESLDGAPRPQPVGRYPHDTSPYGLQDVAGGVQEWTTTMFTGGRWVVRGGSWASDAQACRLASRFGATATERRSTLGFRLFADPR